ncbi:MAG TPA: histidine triad nucleotide-binding protein [Geobacteraceae bacterium]|nr:histidine triad nucleotide-binding protein [Geobacteraceae bacterium]
MEDCIFCRIIKGKMEAEKVYEDDQIIAIRDIAPVAPLHLLIMPKKHMVNTLDLTTDDGPLMGHIFQVAARLARENGVDGSGFRVVCNNNAGAGQSVFHLHFHLLGGRKFHWPPG